MKRTAALFAAALLLASCGSNGPSTVQTAGMANDAPVPESEQTHEAEPVPVASTTPLPSHASAPVDIPDTVGDTAPTSTPTQVAAAVTTPEPTAVPESPSDDDSDSYIDGSTCTDEWELAGTYFEYDLYEMTLDEAAEANCGSRIPAIDWYSPCEQDASDLVASAAFDVGDASYTYHQADYAVQVYGWDIETIEPDPVASAQGKLQSAIDSLDELAAQYSERETERRNSLQIGTAKIGVVTLDGMSLGDAMTVVDTAIQDAYGFYGFTPRQHHVRLADVQSFLQFFSDHLVSAC